MVEQIHERCFPRPRDLRVVEDNEDLRQGARVVERAVRLADVDAELPGEVGQLAARRQQLARQRQRVVRRQIASARETVSIRLRTRIESP